MIYRLFPSMRLGGLNSTGGTTSTIHGAFKSDRPARLYYAKASAEGFV